MTNAWFLCLELVKATVLQDRLARADGLGPSLQAGGSRSGVVKAHSRQWGRKEAGGSGEEPRPTAEGGGHFYF